MRSIALVLLCLSASAQDAETVLQTEPSTWLGHLAFSPGGMLLAGTEFGGGRVVLWNVPTRSYLRSFACAANSNRLYFAGNGSRIVVQSGQKVEVFAADSGRRWEFLRATAELAKDGKGLKPTRKNTYYAMVLGEASPWVVVTHAPKGRPLLVAANTATKKSWTWPAPFSTYPELAVDRTGRHVAGVFGKVLACWDTTKGRQVFQVDLDRPARVFDGRLAFSPDGTRLAVAVRNGIRVHSVPDGRLLASHAVSDPFAWRADGTLLFEDGEGRILAKGRPLIAAGTKGLVFASGRHNGVIAVERRGTPFDAIHAIELYAAGTGRRIGEIRPVVRAPHALFVDERGDLWCDAYHWDLETGDRIPAAANLLGGLVAANRRRIVGFMEERTIYYGPVDGNPREQRIKLPPGPLLIRGSIATTPDLSKLAVADAGHLFILDLDAGKVTRQLKRENGGRVSFIRFAKGGEEVVLGDAKGNFELWDLTTGRMHRETADAFVSKIIKDRSSIRMAAPGAGGKHVLLATEVGLVVMAGGKVAAQRAEAVFAAAAHGDAVAIGRAGGIDLWSVSQAKVMKSFETDAYAVGAVALFAGGRKLAAVASDGSVMLWDTTSGEELARLIAVGDRDHVILLPDGHYQATRGGLEALAFAKGTDAYPFDQFDLKRNRPDLVLRRLGAPSKNVAEQERLRTMRLTRVPGARGTGERPRIAFRARPPLHTRKRRLVLALKATGKELARLHVHMNNVPVPSRRGRPLPSAECDIELDLVPGKNRIQVAVETRSGTLSLRRTHIVFCTAAARPARTYFLGVGVSKYGDPKKDLTYAAKDVHDVASYLASLLGDRYRGRTLSDEGADRGHILGARKFLEQAAVDDTVIVYFAGHGLRDAEKRYFFAARGTDFGRPQGSGLSFTELEDLLDGLKARHRVLFMDTCHAGDMAPGGAKALAGVRHAGGEVSARGLDIDSAPAAISTTVDLEESFVDLRRGTGAMVVAAAGGAEFAFESRQWKNGVFTYALLDGLRSRAADTDGDLTIRLSELRHHTIRLVRNLTRGGQAPTAKRENFEFDVPLVTARRGREVRLEGMAGKFLEAIVSDGTRVAVRTRELVSVHDAATGRSLLKVTPPDKPSRVFLQDGALIVVTDDDRVFRWADGRRAELPAAMTARASTCQILQTPRGLLFSGLPDWDQLLLWPTGGAPRVLELGTMVHRLGWRDGHVVAVASDGRVLAIDPGSVQLKERARLVDHDQLDAFSAKAITAGGRYLASLREADLSVWDLGTGKLVWTHNCPDTVVVLHTDDGPVVLKKGLLGKAKRLQICDLSKQRALRDEAPPYRTHVTTSATALLVCRADGLNDIDPNRRQGARLLDIRTGRDIDWIERPRSLASAVTFSPDGKRLFIATNYGTLQVWDLRN